MNHGVTFLRYFLLLIAVGLQLTGCFTQGFKPYAAVYPKTPGTDEDEAYFFLQGRKALTKINNAGLRRILDRVIANAVEEDQASGAPSGIVK